MTPLITEMIQWADKPELSTWFDLGNVTNTEGRRVEANQVLRLPYDLTSIVGRDKNGEKFALLLKLGNESVTVAGSPKQITGESVPMVHSAKPLSLSPIGLHQKA